MGAASGAFATALAFTLRWEGGVANDPQDHGGPTCRGVTQAVYDTWRKRHGLSIQPVRTATVEECTDVYRELYWLAASCDRLRTPVALIHFDTAVNLGVGEAVKLLQRAVRVDPDGRLGPVTLSALFALPTEIACWRYLQLRRRFYVRLVAETPSDAKYLLGWLRRLRALKHAVRDALVA